MAVFGWLHSAADSYYPLFQNPLLTTYHRSQKLEYLPKPRKTKLIEMLVMHEADAELLTVTESSMDSGIGLIDCAGPFSAKAGPTGISKSLSPVLYLWERVCSGQVLPDTDYGDQAACCSIAIGDR